MPKKKRAFKRVWRDPEDAPEWTAERFARAEIAVGGKVVQPAQGTLTRRRGRPAEEAQRQIAHPYPSLAAGAGLFRATGPGWQTRIDGVLPMGGAAEAAFD